MEERGEKKEGEEASVFMYEMMTLLEHLHQDLSSPSSSPLLLFIQTGADPQVKGEEDLSSQVPDRRNQSGQNQNQLVGSPAGHMTETGVTRRRTRNCQLSSKIKGGV